MTRHTTVLVVGAGPCGLAMAAQLRRLGVDVTVVDAESRPHTGSRAILLWPPVREVLDELGLAEDAARAAVRPAALHYHLGSGGSARVPLGASDLPWSCPRNAPDNCWPRRWRTGAPPWNGARGSPGSPPPRTACAPP